VGSIPPLKRLPVHVAIIMDGNGRWAKKRGLPRIVGHRYGIKAVRRVVTLSRELGIRYLTLYAFSKENWQRPKEEVSALMDLLYEYLEKELDEMLQKDIRLYTIGEIEHLPERVQEKLLAAKERTKENQSMVLCLALSYGGRAEMALAAARIARDCMKGVLDPSRIDEKLFSSYLFTADMPDPDLIIRTSGELRISNFLLFQGAYSELYFTPTYWPDFDRETFLEALRDYGRRERRFGKTSEQVSSLNGSGHP